ncbi:MAG: hypothetical protein JSU68_09340 [Phycisphaerales bacterium]|nr:MAG: hypothetical protein JSU68_09340 [Phycisphaerales bacterium]
MRLRVLLGKRFRWKSWGALLLVASGLHFVSFDIRRQPIATDIDYYLYYARQSARGELPYVDYFEHKTPLGIYTGVWLYRLGEILGTDLLYSIRVGYLILAGLAAAVMGVVFVRLYNNRPAAGWIGLLVYCGFSMLGLMPCIGNLPKMIGLLCAGAAMLAVYARRWFWAGLLVGIAGMDWQPCGALAALGVFLAGAWGSDRMVRWLKLAAGMVLPAVAFSFYFAARGALGIFWKMVLLMSLTKAASDPLSFSDRCRKMWEYVLHDCPGETWLLVLGAAGIILYGIRLVRMRRTSLAPMMVGLGAYHYGMIIFSLVDFQGHGDVFVLLASWAFFAAVPVAEGYYYLLRLKRRFRGRVARSYGPVLGVLVVTALVVACRPSFLRMGWRYNSPLLGWSDYELDSQRQAAERFFQVVGDRDFALVRNQELLFLGKGECPLPFVTWNQGTYVHYRQGDEDRVDTLSRLLRQEDLDFIVLPKTWLPYLRGTAFAPWLLVNYAPIMISSQDEKYYVIVWVHRRVPPPAVRGVRYIEIESLWI